MISLLCAVLLFVAEPSDTTVVIGNVDVTGHARKEQLMKTSQNSVQVGRDFLESNFSGSLMQTLQGIPGVKAMSIGSGLSKPAIRGLGFNRMAVTEDGVKHEGQQWGEDHGLEIDQFSVDRAEVIKGPAALLYGSDAIGGVLNLFTNHIPMKKLEGAVLLFGRSNNESLGGSAKIGGRYGKFFYRLHFTYMDYADYKVPTDSIQYYSYYIRLKDRRLRNTAGRERDGSLMLGYAGYNFHTDVRISDNYSKSGFFANAHGLEVRLSSIDYDRSRRDIDLPYQWVNHLKVLSHTTWTNDFLSLELNLAYQNNQREELSEPVSHGYMPTPQDSLERRFVKNTYTGLLGLRYQLGERHTLQCGLSSEYQHNRRSGWGFIIPDYEMLSFGAYAFDRYTIRENLIVNAGLRYDHVHMNIRHYEDWYKTPVGSGDSLCKQRSADLSRNFNSLTCSAGINWSVGNWVLKGNVGKGFRVPIPKELGADGINYHIFRYERGNAELKPEESYQLDLGLSWSSSAAGQEREGGLTVLLEPYLNYFPNYIYLNPTSDYVEGLQLYHHTQAKVLRYGVEAELKYVLNRHWEAGLKGEYLHARQQSGPKKGYGLPFSPPWSSDIDVKYSFHWKGQGFVALNAHIVGAQHDIVPPEQPTDGYWTLNVLAGKHFPLGKHAILKLTLHANNLLDRRYYDHTSYYRLIDVPEPGRNFSAMLGVEF